MMQSDSRSDDPKKPDIGEGFGELVHFTLMGYLGGLIAGLILDHWGFSRSGLGQWLVRTLAGEGESVFEGYYALRSRRAKKATSMAEAYGWGKFLGMMFPWVIDGASRLVGVDMYGVGSFYVPFFYAMSDQMGASVSGFVYLKRRQRSWRETVTAYLSHPVMVAGLVVIFAVPLGLLLARVVGFSPSTQLRTALETIVANLCWVPPFVGWLRERRLGKATKKP